MLIRVPDLRVLATLASQGGHADATGCRRPGEEHVLGTASFAQALALPRRETMPMRPLIAAVLAAIQPALCEAAQAASMCPLPQQVTLPGTDSKPEGLRMPEGWGPASEAPPGPPPRFVRLLADLAEGTRVSDDDLHASAAALIAAVQLLEMVGCRVEVACGMAWAQPSLDAETVLEVQVKLKDVGERLVPERLALGLAHRAIPQRLMAAVAEQHGVHPGTASPTGLGEPAAADWVAMIERHDHDRLAASVLEQALRIAVEAGLDIAPEVLRRLV